jgi:hypothetical protein
MGYDFEDAWNELKEIFHELKPNEESEIPVSPNSRKWVRDKMSELEKTISPKGG